MLLVCCVLGFIHSSHQVQVQGGSMKLRLTICAHLLIVVCSTGAAFATPVTWLVSGGTLTGATGVTVNGNQYDVQFVDGTCADVFGVCNISNFTFQTDVDAIAASQALLNQVLIDGVVISGLTYNFDAQAELTRGCTDIYCVIATPFLADVGQYYNKAALNFSNESDDGVSDTYVLGISSVPTLVE